MYLRFLLLFFLLALSITVNGCAPAAVGGAAYGGYVEFGRKAGGFPPLAPLETWIKKKGIETDPKKIKSTAFLIGRSIAKNGTKPKPYLIPSCRKNANLLVKNLIKVLRQSGKNKKL